MGELGGWGAMAMGSGLLGSLGEREIDRILVLDILWAPLLSSAVHDLYHR